MISAAFQTTTFQASTFQVERKTNTTTAGLGGEGRRMHEIFKPQKRKREQVEARRPPPKPRTSPNGRLLAALTGDPSLAKLPTLEAKGITEALLGSTPQPQMTDEEAISLFSLTDADPTPTLVASLVALNRSQQVFALMAGGFVQAMTIISQHLAIENGRPREKSIQG